MASHTKKDDFCLECHWEAFHLDVKDPEEPTETEAQVPQWNCSEEEHHPAVPHCDVGEDCHVDDDCCDMDNCSTTCPSVCDGFVDCEEVAECSVSHCDDVHCNDTNCDSTDPVCFDEHCFGSGTNAYGEHSLEALLALGSPLNLESTDLLSSTTLPQAPDEQPKPAGLPATGLVGSTDAFFAPFAPGPMSHCHSHSHQHFQCHDFSKDAHLAWYPMPTSVNPADVFHMMNFHVQQVPDCSEHQKPTDDATSNSFTCFHINPNPNHSHPHNHNHNHNHGHSHSHSHLHTHNAIDTTDMTNLTPTQETPTVTTQRKPCRTHVHRCRTHSHAHHHYSPYSPYSRHSRSSVSSQLSPGETPPPLDGGSSSVLTSPEYIPETESHTCRWTTISADGTKKACGATFSDSCGLQEHLIACHMATVEGAKGTGYYCCWEGCHRPDEPFSQKSKLQGHFLTHSNYKNFKCSVCGKFFARQATLERHERSHRGEKPYKCAECGKSFTDSSELKTHSRTHTGEKPFKCTYPGCNFQTGDMQSSNMSSHRLTHGERRHKCHYPGCTKSFTRHDQLKRHLKSTHKDCSSSTTMPSPLTDQFGLSLAGVASTPPFNSRTRCPTRLRTSARVSASTPCGFSPVSTVAGASAPSSTPNTFSTPARPAASSTDTSRVYSAYTASSSFSASRAASRSDAA
ncbi:uncharacterized protein BO97DRAFT_415133 [Aspergillus homomorphus CBS 101889]|uniref:C2H2-type domain-containing protein n=1 Tax=Aspergillus homomorphus (strain CBS 101889) TaxID=1450537 RepID=A0A395HZ67_ASPHC|nr:hypothetical protein BO97DRAFT_415133 [Aspergillus homomorphus CBS 101889]RAL11554.1 hypothetical protein BO97DRAFT_415133 [Aspergillus homomorphus CBS 101889]